jgi:PAS domain S-box-containing protein
VSRSEQAPSGAQPPPDRERESIDQERELLVEERDRVRALAGYERSVLEGILLHSPHGIIICDAQGQFVLQNRAAERIWAGSAPVHSVGDWQRYRGFHADGRPFAGSDWSMARCLSERQTTEAEEIRIERFDGTRGVLLGSSAPIVGNDGELVGAMSIFADISRFKDLELGNDAAHRRTAFLASAGEVLLTSSRDMEQALDQLAQTAVPAVADWCAIELLHDKTLYCAHVDPAKAEQARALNARRVGMGHLSPAVQRVLRTGRPELHAEVPAQWFQGAADDEPPVRSLRELQMRSVMIVPVSVSGHAFGAITFAICSAGRAYDADDLEMASRLSQKAALALENARLFRAEQQARAAIERATDRAARLASISADLQRALSSDSVAQVVIDHSAAAIGALTAAIWQVEPGETNMRLLRAWNYTDAQRRRFANIPLAGPAPVADAVRRVVPVFIDSDQDYASAYPESARYVRDATGNLPKSMACLPLAVGSRALGVLVFVFPDQRTLDADERTFLMLGAASVAQALYRARIYEAEQRARAESALLYELVDAVSRAATLEEVYETALSSIERVLDVERASILLFDPDGVIRFKAWRGLSDEYRAAVEGHSPWSPDTTSALPIVVADVETDAAHAKYLPTFRKENIGALAFVPLLHGRKLLGKFMVYSQKPRNFSAREIRMASTLGAQVAHAVARKLGDAEIARLLAEAKAARSEAETASRLKDEFLAVVSHELRTPLSVILGWAAVLKTARRDDPATLQKGVDVVERNARAQMKIIEDILDVSRVITGKLVIDPRPLNLSSLIVEALDVVKASAQAKEIAISLVADYDDKYMIVGDPERLRQVAWNLLSNAVKFSQRGGEIDVVLRRETNSIVIEVRDTGRGIAPEFLPYVFERFRQADSSTTRAQGGLGLGLSIVRHLVELHGGQVEAHSAGIDKGSTFIVRLPVPALLPEADLRADATGRFASAPPPPHSAPNPELAGMLRGVRVLIVDDERDARELLHEVLELRGATVYAAASAAAAFDALRAFRPHVLVSDIGMPEEDGYALIRRVRSAGEHERGVAAIALTAYARSEERKRALDAGYDEHLSKPADVNALTKLIARLSDPMRN